MYDRLSIRRIPTLAGLMLMFCTLLLAVGATPSAFATERFTGQEKVRSEASVIRQQPTPRISIAADSTYVGGLGDLVFALTRGGDLTDSLDVTVNIEQDQTWLSTTSYPVNFEANDNEAALKLGARSFSTDVTESGALTASVGAVNGYDVSSAEVTVNVISQAGPAVTVSLDQNSYEFDEDDGEVNITLVARAAVGVPFVSGLLVGVSSDESEASAGLENTDLGDYVSLSEMVPVESSDFDEVENRLVAEVDVPIIIKDDEIYEGDETFGIKLSLRPEASNEIQLIDPDGNACDRICDEEFVVTIKDDEPLPALKISQTTLTIEEGDSGTYTAVLITQPTADVIVTPSGQGLTFDPTSHTFTDENWETAQEIEVSAEDDADKIDNLLRVTHAVSGGGYDDATVPTLTVSVTDDDKTVPSTPQNLGAAPGSMEMRLSWDAPADDGGHDITVYEYKVDSGTWASTGSTDTQFTVPSLTNGTTYEFYVRARNTLGSGAEAGPVESTPRLPAPMNFRVLNGTISNGVHVITDRAPQFDWDVPDEAAGVRLGRYWVRPGHICPEGSDPDRDGTGATPGSCPVLYLWNEFGTRRTGWSDSKQAGGTFVYLLWMMDRDGEHSEPVEVTVEIPEQPYVQVAPSGLWVTSNISRGRLRLEINWNRDSQTRAFIVQWRESGHAYDDAQSGSRSHINAAGPPGSDGVFRYFAEGANPWHYARSRHQVDSGLEFSTLYYVRVGTCLVASCELDDVMWVPGRAVRTPSAPR